jgi:HSP20 family protein
MSNALSIHRAGLLGRTVFDDIFDSMLDIPTLVNRTTQGYPVADIYQNDDGTVLEFALAGFSREDLKIEVKPEKNSITVSAEGDQEEDQTSRRRIAKRNFTKTYVNYDNNLDLSAISAEFENGLLRIVIPTRPEASAITVKIK